MLAVRWKNASDFDVPGHVRRENSGQDFLGGLHQALGPARLLRFEAVHIDGQLGSALDVGKIQKFPAVELRAIGKIGVFGERVVLPAAGVFDGLRRQTPAVPLKLKKVPRRERAPCSTTKWPSSRMVSTWVSSE